MADEVKNVYYRAIADFSALTGPLNNLRKQFQDFGKEQERQHAASKKRLQEEARFGRDRVAQAKTSKIAIDQVTKSLHNQRLALDRLMRAQANLGKTSDGSGYGGSSGEMNSLSNAVNRYAKSIGRLNTQLQANVSLSRSSLTNVRESTKAYQGLGRSIESLVGRMERFNKAQMDTNAVGRVTLGNQKSIVAAIQEATLAARDQSKAISDNAATSRAADSTSKALTETVRKTAREYRNKKRAIDDADASAKKSLPTIQRTGSRWRDAQIGVEKFAAAAKRVGSIRIGRDPTLAKMVGIIAAILSMVNPLAAGLGGVGAAAFAVASNIASIGTAALTAIPGVLALISVVSALKMAFGGVGSALSAGFKGARGGGGGGGGASAPARIPRAELTAQEKLIRANETLRRAVEDVTFAQEDLNDARKDAKRRIDDLRKSVAAAAANELSARADSQLAREAYANIMADPTSTLGDKMSAQANMMQADARIAEVLEENEQARKDLTKAEADGVDGSRDVIMAQRRLTDSIDAVRDAELAIQNVHIDTANALNEVGDAGGAAGGGIDEFAEAMSKLSPSAQLFVRNVLAMKDAWNEVQQTVQENFFREWAADVPRLTKTFPALQYALGLVATELGKIAKATIDLVTSDKWINDLYEMGDITAPVVRSIGDGAVYLLDAVMDLSIAAGPALQRLADGFANGSEKLRDLISAGRESGALSDAINDAVTTMGQWWRIIKNTAIAVTNFGSAASDLGQWIVDGLEDLTAGWAESSRRAMQDGSPFKTFLEDIKPLLRAVNDLVGDFFGWFASVAGDPRNIQHMTDIVNVIKDDLGPALARILGAFSDTDLASDLVSVIANLVDILADFLESGGAEALALLVGGLADLSSFLADTGLGAMLLAVAAGITAIGAASKGVRGLQSLLSVLSGGMVINGRGSGRHGSGTTVVGGRPTGTVPAGSTSPRDQAGTSARSGRGGILGGLGRGAGRAGGALGRVGGAALAGLGLLGGMIPWGGFGGGGQTAPKTPTFAAPSGASSAYGTGNRGWTWNQNGAVTTPTSTIGAGSGTTTTPRKPTVTAPKPSGGGSMLSRLGKGVGKGGVVGMVTGLVSGLASGFIQDTMGEVLTGESTDTADVFGQQVNQGTLRTHGNIASGMADGGALGAGIGATIGSIVPVVGTAAGGLVGGAIGGAIGGVSGFFNTDEEDRQTFFDDTIGMFEDMFEHIGNFFTDIFTGIGDFFGGAGQFFEDMFGNIGGWITEQWEALQEWVLQLPYNLGVLAGNIWNFIQGIGPWLDERRTEFILWAAQLIIDAGAAWNNFWENTFPDIMDWIGKTAAAVWNWVINLPSTVANAWNNFWGRTFPDIMAWVNRTAANIWSWVTGLPGQISRAWNNLWGVAIPGIWDKLNSIGQAIWNWAVNIPRNVANAIGNIFKYVWGEFSMGFESTQGGGRKNSGGRVLRRAAGGDVPLVPGNGNGDTVSALLTPGEFVVRKQVVSQVGPENLARLNSGVMSFADMLQQVVSEGNSTATGNTKLRFSTGGIVGLAGKYSGGNARVSRVIGLAQPKVAKNTGSTPVASGNATPKPSTPTETTPAPVDTSDKITIENFNVTNPVPEPASDTLPKQVRKLGYKGR